MMLSPNGVWLGWGYNVTLNGTTGYFEFIEWNLLNT